MRAPNWHPLRAPPSCIFRASAKNCQFVTMRNEGQNPSVLPLSAFALFRLPFRGRARRSALPFPLALARGRETLGSTPSSLFARASKCPQAGTLANAPLRAPPPCQVQFPLGNPPSGPQPVALLRASASLLRKAGLVSARGSAPHLAFVSPAFSPPCNPPTPLFKGGFLFLRFALYRFSFLLQGLRKCPRAGNLAKFIEKRSPANTGNQWFFSDVVYITPFFEIKS